jgi:hypothetical protein
MKTSEQTRRTVDHQAERIRLAREAAMLTELVAELTPYAGELPETMEQYRALPAAHRRQLALKHPEHVGSLQQVEELMEHAAAADRRGAQSRQELAGLPVDSPEAFAALPPHERARLALSLTRRQRLALCGQPVEENEGYL